MMSAAAVATASAAGSEVAEVTGTGFSEVAEVAEYTLTLP
jgi:hypothetical protein